MCRCIDVSQIIVAGRPLIELACRAALPRELCRNQIMAYLTDSKQFEDKII